MENDLISRKELKEILISRGYTGARLHGIIDNVPTVERPQDEWDMRHTELLKYFVKCEKCGEEIMTSHKNYCPNCGVKIKSDLDGFGVSGY